MVIIDCGGQKDNPEVAQASQAVDPVRADTLYAACGAGHSPKTHVFARPTLQGGSTVRLSC